MSPSASPSIETLIQLLARAGEAPADSTAATIPAAKLQHAAQLLSTCQLDPGEATVQRLKAERELKHTRGTCNRLMGTLEEMQQALAGLLGVKPVLCRLEGLHAVGAPAGPAENGDPLGDMLFAFDDDEEGASAEARSGDPARTRAIVALGGQLREVSIHESIALERLRALEPWSYVLVHPDELVLVGIYDDPALFERSRGEVVEFQGFVSEADGLVRIARMGHQESVARLAPALRARELAPASRLVLLRGDERWVIDVVPTEGLRSPFEVPLEEIRHSFEMLAGLERVIEPLLHDVLLRVVQPEEGERFQVRPCRGVVLSSKRPGTGKTATVRAYARFVHELGQELGFDVVLYSVPPGALKSVWHGGDVLRVRNDLCGPIRARARAPRTRALYQIVFLDELDSLGKREGHDFSSGAQNEATLALLTELDGLRSWDVGPGNAPAHLIWIGATNRVDRIDGALMRNRRFADLELSMPELTFEGAEEVLFVHAGRVPWYWNGEICADLEADELRAGFLRPALARVFHQTVLQYFVDGRNSGQPVTAGGLLAGVHYEAVMNDARGTAAKRAALRTGVPAVTFDDLLESLIAQACRAARRMDEDRAALARELGIQARITRVELVDAEELATHRYLEVQAS